MKNIFLALLFLITTTSFAQKGYQDSMNTYISNYVNNHEVVQGDDKSRMRFYKADTTYRVVARFTPAKKADWIKFKTSGTLIKTFKVYGTLRFNIEGKPQQLTIYQSQEFATVPQYKNYLFLPFTDATTGVETYSGGRYLDFTTEDIKSGKLILDFNKAYNPYCAYVSGKYNCPIPPKENMLSAAIYAGEKIYAGGH